MQKSNLGNYLHLHLIVFIWGFTAILGKLISIDAIPLVWYRMLLASGFILVYLAVKKKNLKLRPKQLLVYTITGGIIALHWVTFFEAIKVSNVSVALATMSSGAFFTSFIEPIVFKRKINPVEILFGLLVIVGLYIIFSVDSSYTLGIVFALISAFLAAVFSVINGKLVQKQEASIISFYQLFAGALWVSLYLLFRGDFTLEFFSISYSDWGYIAILSSFCTAYAFIVSVHIMKFLTPYTVMLTINLEPVYGIILALLIFGESEKMGSGFYFGSLLILLVIVLNGIVKNYNVKKISK